MTRLIRRWQHTPRHSVHVGDPNPLPAADPWQVGEAFHWDTPTAFYLGVG